MLQPDAATAIRLRCETGAVAVQAARRPDFVLRAAGRAARAGLRLLLGAAAVRFCAVRFLGGFAVLFAIAFFLAILAIALLSLPASLLFSTLVGVRAPPTARIALVPRPLKMQHER